MDAPWQVEVYDGQRQVYVAAAGDRPLELGRQSTRDEPLYTAAEQTGRRRVAIARFNEDSISRRHALLEPAPAAVRLTNLSRKIPLRLEDGTDLAPGAARELPLPAVFAVGSRTVYVQPPDAEAARLEALSEVTLAPGALLRSTGQLATLATAGTGLEPEGLIRWLQTAVAVLQSAATSSDFFAQAARAVVELVGLDSGHVLLLHGGEWKVEAQHTAATVRPDSSWQPSRQVLARLREERRTFWQVPGHSASLVEVKAVVAAPILDRQGQVIGALYGDRRRATVTRPITRAEAMLVELLAVGVAAGLARLEQERAALAARIQFEQFFTPELSRHLAAQPDLLEGKECPVSILFCDIRGFSRISERLAPDVTMAWLRDVLGTLSDCVLDWQGVLVDYTGDELMAMWGAPAEQPDHARRACAAALAMLGQLPQINRRWQDVLGEPMGLGIGVNTGPARVGNTGSHRKFKYGPHGTTVNLASRVQGATRYLKAPVLVTGATEAQLGGAFPTRRLCRVRVVNIKEPVDLYDLVPAGQASWAERKLLYEAALEEFERGGHGKAADLLGRLLAEFPGDGPSAVLRARAQQAEREGGSMDSRVWLLPGK